MACGIELPTDLKNSLQTIIWEIYILNYWVITGFPVTAVEYTLIRAEGR